MFCIAERERTFSVNEVTVASSNSCLYIVILTRDIIRPVFTG